jgi:UPF0755 protein
MNKKIILGIVLIGLLIAGFVGYHYYQKIFSENVTKSGYLFIKSSDQLEDVSVSLQEFVADSDSFLWVADQKEFSNVKPGRYEIKEGMSNNDLVNLLRSGRQSPVKVSFNNQETLEKLAGRIATEIEADSLSLIEAFTDSTFLAENKISKAQMLGYFIPNTYEFFWNTSAEQFRERMFKEHSRFWNEERLKKAKEINMTPNEVMALASIVYKETPKAVEQPRVAGLYMNRIKVGMPLQADPTIIYALKQVHGQDFVVKRVLNKDLKINSPYNTYLNRGVPPSLIAMPDISAIDAVLNYERHDYLYMCVDVDNLGYHAFASTISQHTKNARKYHNWLNTQGIRR